MCSRLWGSSVIGIAAVFLTVLLLMPSAVEAQDGWIWQNPLPQGNTLYAVWGSSGSDVFAVGAAGTIIHYDGATWTAQPSGTNENLMAVWGSSAGNVYAVGGDFYRGIILYYDGTGWVNQNVSADELHAVWGSSAGDIFVVGRQGTILHYDGTSWSRMASGTWSNLHGVWGSSGTDVFAVADDGTLLHYDGANWSSTNLGSYGWLGLWGASPTDVYAVNNNGAIQHFDGVSWNPSAQVEGSIVGVWGSSASDIFAIGRAVGDVTGAIWHFAGTSWSAVPGAFPDTFTAVWGSGPADVFAVGSGGAILHFDGTTWTPMHSRILSGELRAVWGSNADDIFAVGDMGSILHYDGATWSVVSSPTTAALEAMWGSSSADIFAVGAGVILHYDGAQWSIMDSSPPFGYLHGVWGTSANDVFAVGGEGAVFHYNGTSWSPMFSDTLGELNAVWGSNSNDVFAVGQAGTIVHYDGTSWSSMPSGTRNTLNDVWGASGSDVLAVGGIGTILHFDGANWQAMTSPSPSASYWDVWGTGTGDIYLIGERSILYHFDGSAWRAMETHVSGYLHDVWGDCTRGVFAVGVAILRHPGCWLNVTVPAGETGVVKSTPPAIDCGSWLSPACSAAFEYATPVTLSVTPHPFASFLGWSGACRDLGPCNLTMDANKAVTAAFALRLKVNKVGDGNGAVTSSPPAIDCGAKCQASVLGGTTITLTATTGAYSIFDGWTFPTDYSGFPTGFCATNLPCALTMNTAKEVTATFTLQAPPGAFPLVVIKAGDGSGMVTSSPPGIDCGSTCSAPLPAGTEITLTATAGAFSAFTGWSEPCTGTGLCTITLDAAKHVTATFTLQTFPLTLNKTGIGSGTVTSSPPGIDCGSTCSASFSGGQLVALTASPGASMAFTGWSGACAGAGVCTVTMDAAKVVTATFTIPGAVLPAADTMYYGEQLVVSQSPNALAPAIQSAATYLVIFPGPAPAGIYLLGVQGSQPYVDQTSTHRLINQLLHVGCAGSACSAVNCTWYTPDGVHTGIVITDMITTDHLYLPLTRRK